MTKSQSLPEGIRRRGDSFYSDVRVGGRRIRRRLAADLPSAVDVLEQLRRQLGSPCSPLRLEIYGARTRDDLELLKSLGFTQVIIDDLRLARTAESIGFSVVLANWWDSNTDWSWIKRRLQNARRLNSLVSINMMDEPFHNGIDTHSPQLYGDLRRRIHALWPGAPLSLTIYGPDTDWSAAQLEQFMDYLETIDVLRIDPYPYLVGRPLSLVYRWIEQSRLLMREARREVPITVILQAWSQSDDIEGRPQLPPMESLRVMGYLALLSRVDVVSIFSYDRTVWDRYPGFYDGLVTTIRELQQLVDELASSQIRTVLGGDEILRAQVTRDGKQDCYAINTLFRHNGGLPPLTVHREATSNEV